MILLPESLKSKTFSSWMVTLFLCVFVSATQTLSAQDLLLKEITSREFSINVGSQEFSPPREIVSREFSLYIENGSAIGQTLSREFSLAVSSSQTPPPVTSIAITVSPTGDSVDLDWSAYNPFQYGDISEFLIFLSDDSPITDITGLPPIATVSGNTTSTTLSGLTQFTDHFIAIVAVDSSGNFDPIVVNSTAYVLSPEIISREVSLFVGGETTPPYREIISREYDLAIYGNDPPSPVTNLMVTSSPSGDQATLDWSSYNQWDEAAVTHFDIYLSDNGAISSLSGLIPVLTVPGNQNSTTLTNLTPGIDHFFVVVPVDSGGNFSPEIEYAAAYVLSPEVVSREISLSIGSGITPEYPEVVSREFDILVPSSAVPEPVTGISSGFTISTSTTQFGAVLLDFSSYNEVAQLDIIGYDVYLADNFFDNTAGLTPFTRLPSGNLTPTLAGLPGGVIKHFAVVAIDALGGFDPVVRSFSAQSSISGVGEVTNLMGTSSVDSLSFSWLPPENASAFLENYRLFFGTDAPLDLPLTETSAIFSNLSPATGYTFRISTVDIFGNVSPGNSISASTWLPNPNDPFLTLGSGDNVQLVWSEAQPSSLVSFYAIYSSNSPISDISGLTPDTTTTGLEAIVGTTSSTQGKYYAVAAVNSLGDRDPSVTSVLADKMAQTINFPTPPVGASSISLTANSTSGLPVSFSSSNDAVATISGNTLTVLQGGAVTITASQAGNSTFWPAPAVEVDLRLPPVITSFTASNTELENGQTLTQIDELLRLTAVDLDGIVTSEFFIRPMGGTFTSLGRDLIPGNGLTALLALDSFPSGDYDLKAVAETPEGIAGETIRSVTLALGPPMPPTFQTPGNNVTVNTESIQVSGLASRNSQVTVFVNGIAQGSPTSTTNGQFEKTITLSPGPNNITAQATSPAGDSALSATLQVTLRVTLSISVASTIAEGATIPVTVTRNTSQGNTTVSFSESVFGQLDLPDPLLIPDGQTSASTTVTAIDDSVAETDEVISFTATATGFIPAAELLAVIDNDRPNLTLSINRTSISEGDVSSVLQATLTRSPVTSSAFSVELLNSAPEKLQSPSLTSFPAFTESVIIPLRPIDNDIPDSDVIANLSAQILDVTTDQVIAQTAVSNLTITDDDGPALFLTLAQASVREGQAVLATLSRNSGENTNLEVSLNADPANLVQLPSTISFVAGETELVFSVGTLDNGIEDGNRELTITATAPGYSAGQVPLVTTDLNLPDLAVTQLSHMSSAPTDDTLSYTYRIENQGAEATLSDFIVRVFLSDDPLLDPEDTAVNTFTFESSLPAGLFFERAENLTTPSNTGSYWLIVQVDRENVVEEILEVNNLSLSATPIEINAAYEATVSTDVEVSNSNTPITLTGSATEILTGSPAAQKPVNIHIGLRGTSRIITAFTDSNGEFTTMFTPLPGEAGVYSIGATHPGVSQPEAQDSFTILGISSDPKTIETTVVRNSSPTQGTLTLKNLANLPLNGIQVTPVGFSAGITVDASLASGATSLTALGDAQIDWSITADDSAPSEAFGTLQVTSSEGAELSINVNLTASSLSSRLSYIGEQLRAGTTRGEQTFVTFTLSNKGSAPTGPLNIILPQLGNGFVSSATASPTASLDPREEINISLQICPSLETTLGSYTGSLIVQGNDNSVAIPFDFRVVSNATGSLVVSVEDELTYWDADGGYPKVSDANVVLIDPISGNAIRSVTTSVEGQAEFTDIPEGFYSIRASADQHQTRQIQVEISPGVENNSVIFLPRSTVTYTWSVTPVEIEDRYEITVETIFETNVPAPVVTIEPAFIDLEALTEDNNQINLTITNHGLIAAQDIALSLGSNEEWEISALSEDLGTLAAKSSYVVPLTINRRPPVTNPIVATIAAGCRPVAARVNWSYMCGDFDINGSAVIGFNGNPSNCNAEFTPRGRPGGRGGRAVINSPSPITIESFVSCDPCILKSLFDCAIGFTPIGCPYGIFENARSCANAEGSFVRQMVTCAIEGGQAGFGCACQLPVCNAVNCFIDILQCIEGSGGGGGGGGGGPGGGGGGEGLLLSPITAPNAVTGSEYASLLANFQSAGEDLKTLLDLELSYFGNPAWSDLFITPEIEPFREELNRILAETDDVSAPIDASDRLDLLATTIGSENGDLVNEFCDRLNRTFTYNMQGIYRTTEVPADQSLDFISYDGVTNALDQVIAAYDRARAAGFENPIRAFEAARRPLLRFLSQGDGVCARVKLRITQEAVLTREGFEAALEINNSDETALNDVNVSLKITDPTGLDATELFSLPTPETMNFSGGTIAGNTSASWKWLLVPLPEAAPTVPTSYDVEGVITYTFDGDTITIPLVPERILVFPSPNLRIKYFHQRDVYSDDPKTDIIEPAIPFTLGVMVENTGAGTANSFKLTSSQPEIIENEKGLLVDFEIISSEVAGEPSSPGLTASFNNIGPSEIKVARWQMISSLQGLFTDYSATFEHITDLGDERLSLIESVDIHELNHQVTALGVKDDGVPDFLTNDIFDLRDLPDTIHLSDGTTAPVTVNESAMVPDISAGNLTVTLSASGLGQPGWNYLRIPDPGQGDFILVSATRSDGMVIPLDVNIWTTDRTFIGLGKEPIRENILHLLDCGGSGVYQLTYAPAALPDTTPPSSSITMLPPASGNFFSVAWTGTDDISIASHSIFVSENGGAFAPWLTNTSQSSALYQGTTGSNYAFYSIARDTSGNIEAPKTTAEASTTVSLANQAPQLPVIDPVIINEGQTLVRRIIGSDPDGPDDQLRYSVSTSPSQPGLVINPVTGRLVWGTGESNGGTSTSVTVTVTDSAPIPLSSSATFSVTVQDNNTAPVLTQPGSFVLDVGENLSLSLSATDADEPAQLIQYRFASSAPAGMTLSPAGLLSWTPDSSAENQSFEIILEAYDDQSPEGTSQASLIVDVLKQIGEPPVFETFPILIWPTESTRKVTLNATDPEGEPVTLTLDINSLPGWNSTHSQEGAGSATLHWNTTSVSPGVYEIPVTAETDRQSTSATLPIQIISLGVYESFTEWINAYGITGADADPNAVLNPQRIPNILAYAMGIDPVAGISPAQPYPAPSISLPANTPAFRFLLPNEGRTDLNYIIEWNNSLSGDWQQIATKNGQGAWQGTGTVQEEAALPGTEFTTTTPPIPGQIGFFRLKVQELP